MNTHPYTLTKLNEQRLESLQYDSRLGLASKGRRINIINYLQNLYNQVARQNQSQQCCTQN
ncbi:hypothetical protein B4U37_17250 [Sutcliffiella horikoshii]|uniref:SAP domain-containing protein n=1 Tax=Sutcliffiella horikoshii TaxID=79883 RepID=A0ABN4ZJU8_9BACI|nr:hypothetical protein [Sutcliffiella horikoshii]ART77694.1 hypothetical protein B4U37_17250 [Sutcliffiella horikoshii]